MKPSQCEACRAVGPTVMCNLCPTGPRRSVQLPATPQEPDLREDIERHNAEIQRLGNAVRDGSATPEMAYAWLTHPYVCTSDMVKAAARIMASAPPAVWQPIETAPKDGTEVLIYDAAWCGGPPRREVSRWTWTINRKGERIGGDWSGVSAPTHWMPLPSPPDPRRHTAMSTVRVEKCPECGTYVGEGTLYDHQQRLCPRRIIAASKRVRVTPTCPFCGVVEPCRVHVVAPEGLPPMSAPGADPLAAIRAFVADIQDRIDYMHRDTDWYRAQELEYWKRKLERLLESEQ